MRLELVGYGVGGRYSHAPFVAAALVLEAIAADVPSIADKPFAPVLTAGRARQRGEPL